MITFKKLKTIKQRLIMKTDIIPSQLTLAGAPSECVKLAKIGTRLHPGGGVPQDRPPKLLRRREAGGQGLRPTNGQGGKAHFPQQI